MPKVKKAGCILINLDTKQIALVCRNGEYSFPKGHLEDNENLEECAIRETREEIGHNCHIIGEKEISILSYNTPRGEDVENYYYLAIDDGVCDEEIPGDVSEVSVWKDIREVEEFLSYQNIKEMWNRIKAYVERVIKDNKK